MKANEISKNKQGITDILTQPKIVKYCTLVGLLTFIICIFVGYIVAQFDHQGYNIIDNYVSDLGSINHTPFPYFLDIGSMVMAPLLIPTALYIEKQLVPLPQNEQELEKISRMRLRLGSYGFIWMLIGTIGMFGVGLFSEDRTTALNLHKLFSIIAFIGLAMTGFFYGLLITFYSTILPKLLGIYMIIGPSLACSILFFFNFQPIHEWILFTSVWAYITPMSLYFLKQINSELKSTS